MLFVITDVNVTAAYETYFFTKIKWLKINWSVETYSK